MPNDQGSSKLFGQRAIVTGGSRGIGAAIARALARERADVAIFHRQDDENADRVVDNIRTDGGTAIAIEFDVSNAATVRDAVDGASKQLGPPNILVNCAGIGDGGPLESLSVETWFKVINTNLTGPFLMAQACVPYMRRLGGGRIINISSQMAYSGCADDAPYCASKAGLIGLTRALAVELAPAGILVNAVAPGATSTAMLQACGEPLSKKILAGIPLGRFAEADEIAPTVVFLASDAGSFYVGQTLSPNGGDVLL